MDCRITRYGDTRVLTDLGQLALWVEKIRVDPPSFILVNLCPISAHTGTGMEQKQIRSLRRLLNACRHVSLQKRSCVLYLVGTRSLPTFEIPEMIELGEQMFSHLVRWANLGVEMPDGTLPKTSSIVWCSAHTLSDLSGWRSDKSYAREAVSSDRDAYSNRPVSPARRARGHAFRTALVLLFLGSARADSTRVDGVLSTANSGVKTVETDVPRS